jgi:hypothetical protein
MILRICLLILFTLQAQAREWDLHEASLKASVEKIREKEKKIVEIVKQKNLLPPDSPKAKPILEELTKEHKELSEFYKDFETEKQHVRFEHPEQGLKVERKYLRYKVKTIEDFENEVGIDGKLSRLKSKTMKKFGEKTTQETVVPDNEPNLEEQLLKEAEAAVKEEEKNSKRVRMKK